MVSLMPLLSRSCRIIVALNQSEEMRRVHQAILLLRPACHVDHAPDAEQLFRLLLPAASPKREGHPYRPALILLDGALGDSEDASVLRRIKSEPAFRRVPTIVLLKNPSPEEVARIYTEGANACFNFPKTDEEAREAMHSLLAFWTDVASLPALV